MVLIWSRRLPPQSSLSRLKVSRCQIFQARPCHCWSPWRMVVTSLLLCEFPEYLFETCKPKMTCSAFELMTIQDLPLQPQLRSRPFFILTDYSISNLFLSVWFFWGQGQAKGFPYVSMVGCLLKGKRSSFGQGALSLHNERARVEKPIQASSAQFAVSTHLEIFASWFAQLIKLSWALGWLYVAFTCFIFVEYCCESQLSGSN